MSDFANKCLTSQITLSTHLNHPHTPYWPPPPHKKTAHCHGLNTSHKLSLPNRPSKTSHLLKVHTFHKQATLYKEFFFSGQFTDAEFCIFVGYVVQGSNGEYAYMKAEEKIALVQKVRELAPKDKLILAGSGCEGECCSDL